MLNVPSLRTPPSPTSMLRSPRSLPAPRSFAPSRLTLTHLPTTGLMRLREESELVNNNSVNRLVVGRVHSLTSEQLSRQQQTDR